MGVTDDVGGLLARVAAGDAAAFELLYRQTASLLLGAIVRIVRDRALGEEVLQEVFTTVWTTSERFDPERGSGKAWLVTLARRRAIDCVRSVQAQRDRDAADAARGQVDGRTPVAEEALERMDAEVTAKRLGELAKPQAQALYLAYYEGLSHAEIARRLDTPLGTVKSRIRDGMAALRKTLGGNDGRR